MNGTAIIGQEKSPVRILQWGMLGGRGGIEMFIVNPYRAIDHCPTHYFACSNLAADYMFPGKPYTWVKNGIDTGEFAFSERVRGDVRKSMGLSASTTVIGFCGRLREQKNPLFAVDVFAAYHAMNPDSKFMVVGDGELMEPMRQRVTEQGLPEGAVLFMGGERDDVSRLYQAMDALLMPSRFEGLPLVLIEAQTAGLPCVASDVITQDAKVTDLVHFVPLTSAPQVWADAMRRGIAEAEERKSRAGEVRAAGFDMAQTAAQLCAFYTEHAGRNQR